MGVPDVTLVYCDDLYWRILKYDEGFDVSWRMLTYTDVYWRVLTCADVCCKHLYRLLKECVFLPVTLSQVTPSSSSCRVCTSIWLNGFLDPATLGCRGVLGLNRSTYTLMILLSCLEVKTTTTLVTSGPTMYLLISSWHISWHDMSLTHSRQSPTCTLRTSPLDRS